MNSKSECDQELTGSTEDTNQLPAPFRLSDIPSQPVSTSPGGDSSNLARRAPLPLSFHSNSNYGFGQLFEPGAQTSVELFEDVPRNSTKVQEKRSLQKLEDCEPFQHSNERQYKYHHAIVNLTSTHQEQDQQLQGFEGSVTELEQLDSFLLSESQANYIFRLGNFLDSSFPTLAGSAPEVNIGFNVEGTTVGVVEPEFPRSMQLSPKNTAGQIRSENNTTNHGSQPSPASFVTQAEGSRTPSTPFIPVHTATATRRRGRGRQQSLSSPPGVRIEELQLPQTQEDPVVTACRSILRRKGVNGHEKDSLDMFRNTLAHLEEVTEKNKIRERERLKSSCCDDGSKNQNASRMEARLSRYKKDAYTVLIQNEFEKLTKSFCVLKEYFETVSEDNNFNFCSSSRFGGSHAEISCFGKETENNPAKKRKFK